MKLALPTRQPFSFAQTLAFVNRFAPCRDECVLAPDALTAALVIAGKPVAFTLRAHGNHVELEAPAEGNGIDRELLVRRARDFIGADDDVATFYAAARGDAPMTGLIEQLYGLHHVRFLTLAEIAVYCVMMQRASITMASAMKRRFLARFGIPVQGSTLRAWPELATLAEQGGQTIGDAIGNRLRGPQIATVVRGVAAIGEARLREAPYAEARDALLAIPGVGPFSAAAVLLRGLGRMDELPAMPQFETAARALYGPQYDAAAIARRYGRQIGYWSYYLKTGIVRSSPHEESGDSRLGSGRRRAGEGVPRERLRRHARIARAGQARGVEATGDR
jgi:DNA-3-methyladenine glycosylase II